MFMCETKTLIGSINYIIAKTNSFDFDDLHKIMYNADKHHLEHYGSLTSFCNYKIFHNRIYNLDLLDMLSNITSLERWNLHFGS